MIINYDNKDYICYTHKINFVSYCNDCKKNLCIKCAKEHKKHKILKFEDLLLDDNEVLKLIKEQK